jgi:hypothetical protein
MTMRSAILAAIVPAALALGACASGDGKEGEGGARAGQRSFAVGEFDRIVLAGSQEVIVTVGGPASVRAEGDERALERLEIEVDGGRLRIGSRRGGSWFGGSRRGVTVHVTVPSLTGAELAGSGEMRIDRIEGNSFEGGLAGSGELEIGAVRVEQARFSIAGSGNIRAAGSAGQANVRIAGSGDADLSGLESRTAEVSVLGSGDAQLRATETAQVTVMGSGDVTIQGGARCSVEKRGSGDVHCG